MTTETNEGALGFQDLCDRVILKGLCTTCGACAGVCPQKAVAMHIENYESDDPAPTLTGDCINCGACVAVCPGQSVPLAELDTFAFGRQRDCAQEPIGIYKRTLRGYAQGPNREIASSGGVVTAVLRYALDHDVIDGAIVAVRDPEHPWRTRAGIIICSKDVSRSVRSVYEMVPVLSALREAVAERGLKRLAVVGLPCQIHSIRKMQMSGQPQELADAVVLAIGLHCTSTCYFCGVEHLLKEIGGFKHFDDIVTMDTRVGKWHGPVCVTTKDNKVHTISTEWLYDEYAVVTEKRDRCTMCTDYSSELADISCGDILQSMPGSQRWTCTTTRTEIGDRLIDQAAAAGYIYVEPHDAMNLLSSGFSWEAVKHGCTLRWMLRKQNGWPVPDYQYEPAITLYPRKIARPQQ